MRLTAEIARVQTELTQKRQARERAATDFAVRLQTEQKEFLDAMRKRGKAHPKVEAVLTQIKTQRNDLDVLKGQIMEAKQNKLKRDKKVKEKERLLSELNEMQAQMLASKKEKKVLKSDINKKEKQVRFLKVEIGKIYGASS